MCKYFFHGFTPSIDQILCAYQTHNSANCTCNSAAISNNEYIVKRACCLLKLFFFCHFFSFWTIDHCRWLVGLSSVGPCCSYMCAVVPIATSFSFTRTYVHTLQTHFKSFSSNSACHCFSLYLFFNVIHVHYVICYAFLIHACMLACMCAVFLIVFLFTAVMQ